MKPEGINISEKSRKFSISKVLYIIAIVVSVLGVALLVNNIYLYMINIKQYIAQGYNAASVIGNLLPSQLLPGIFQPIAVYGGIAFILWGLAIVDKKVSKCLMLQTEDEYDNNAVEENTPEQNVADSENTIEQTENPNEIEKPQP